MGRVRERRTVGHRGLEQHLSRYTGSPGSRRASIPFRRTVNIGKDCDALEFGDCYGEPQLATPVPGGGRPFDSAPPRWDTREAVDAASGPDRPETSAALNASGGPGVPPS
ncbi:hypothetical protein GCM10010199_09220 [Dactylosporangium roseum]